MKKISFLIFMIIFCASCKNETQQKVLENGIYRATLEVDEVNELAFNFEVVSPEKLLIYNGEERIPVDEISYVNDSIRINFAVYEGYISAKFEGNNLKGAYIKESLDRVVPFKAEFDNAIRFKVNKPSSEKIEGIWEMLFTEDDGSTFIGKGIFEQSDDKVTGTIRTTTGDYRYLEGVISDSDVQYSAFDGAHAFLFTSRIRGDSLTGTFYSGNHYKAQFTAIRSPDFELPSEESLTYLNEGYDSLVFSFPDADGNLVSLEDERFKNKVIIVQIMGTWCPNCLDESIYYSKYYSENKNAQLEFVALAFEYAKTEEKAFAGINRLKNRLSINYPILLAQYGTSDKKEAQKKLPMLNHVLSYPTTIFIDKKGAVRKIHTGFNGPATGEKYTAFKKDFESFVEQLINEK